MEETLTVASASCCSSARVRPVWSGLVGRDCLDMLGTVGVVVPLARSVWEIRLRSFDACNLVFVEISADWGLGEGDRLMDRNFSLTFLPRPMIRFSIGCRCRQTMRWTKMVAVMVIDKSWWLCNVLASFQFDVVPSHGCRVFFPCHWDSCSYCILAHQRWSSRNTLLVLSPCHKLKSEFALPVEVASSVGLRVKGVGKLHRLFYTCNLQ
jgi:hypothetical protein